MLARADLRWALSACALSIAVIAGLALRWWVFLRRQGMAVPYRTVFELTWAGQFFNSILPGSTGGDFVKVYQVCRLLPERKADGAATVIVDRLSAVVALLLLAAIALAVEPGPLRVLGDARLPILSIILVALVVATIAWLILRAVQPAALLSRVNRVFSACREALSLDAVLLGAFLLAIAIHLLNFFIVYGFARALGIGISYPQTLMMMPVVLFLLMVPITINGHGLREVLLIAYFTYLHVTFSGAASAGTQEIVVALSVLVVGNDLVWSVPGGILYFARFRNPRSATTDSATAEVAAGSTAAHQS